MITAPDEAWERLGDLLVQRRIDLAPRYHVRTLFAAEAGLHWRLLHDIERHKRSNFTGETLAAVEVAYRWRAGSIARVLVGGDPQPLENGTAAEERNRPSGFSVEDELVIARFAELMERRRAAAQRDTGTQPDEEGGEKANGANGRPA
jgi:hypothetical protein